MKNKKTIIVLSMVAVIVVIALVLGILYFTTDLFRTNKQLFCKYISEINVEDENFTQIYNLTNDKLTKNSNSSTANIKISTSTQNQETGITDNQELINIKSNGLKNVNLKQEYRDFILSSNEQQFLTLKYMRDDNTYAITADNILAKYLAVENTNLKEIFTKLGVQDVSTIPDSIPTNYEEILKIDEETLSALTATYGTLIYDNINEENFYKVKNEDKTQTIGVSLTEQEVSNILKLSLETAKNDSTLLNLITSKAQLLGYANITAENIQTELQNYIDEINNNEYSTEKDFLNLSLIKKDKEVIKIKIETNYIEDVEQYDESTDTQVENVVNSKIEIDFSELNKTTILVKESDTQLMKLIATYSYDSNIINYNVEVEYNDGEKTSNTNIQYKINNYQTDNITQNCIIFVNANNDTDYQIDITNQTNLKQDVTIEKLTTENSAKLNDMTSEELETLFTAIVTRIMTLYGINTTNISM